MFREMRRKDKIKTTEEAVEILKTARTGMMSVHGDDGYPYGVPVNFAYNDDKLYFHCAMTGHKIDAIKADPKVCFTVVAEDEIMSEAYNTKFLSAICFGKARLVEDDETKRMACIKILEKYSPEFMEGGIQHMEDKWAVTAVVEIEIEHLTAKGFVQR